VGPIALIGSGPDESVIHEAATQKLGPKRVLLLPAYDHAAIHELLFATEVPDNEITPSPNAVDPWSIFVNPSTSEVLCTATAEALAMGKTVIVPRHPSNEFFYPFTNCRVYNTPVEFATELRAAAFTQPTPPPETELGLLSWASATARLADAVALPPNGATLAKRPTESIWSRLAHEVNLCFRRGLLGKVVKLCTNAIWITLCCSISLNFCLQVMHYDCYMVLEEWSDTTPEASSRSWRRACEYLF
jgi:hypothetical protein